MQEFYTNVQRYGGTMLVRGVDAQGISFKKRLKYKPYVFMPATTQALKDQSEYKSLEGEGMKRIDFASMTKAKDFCKQYKGVAGMPIYGLLDYQYQYINDCYAGADYDFKRLKIFNIDIEVGCDDEDGNVFGFPYPEDTRGEVTAITIGYKHKFFVWGCQDFKTDRKDVHYQKCKTEKQLLKRFVNFWAHIEPDAVTGWNIQFFDIPYLVRRIEKILGEEDVKKLSPWRMVREKPVRGFGGKDVLAYDVVGLSILDYQYIYKKFTFTTPENYSLNAVSQLELDEAKLDYSEVASLHLLYKTNFQKYIEYNIKDVELVWKLEDKLRLLEMIVSLAYDAGVNYNDTFTQVRMWDVMIHNKLMKSKIVVPPKKNNIQTAFSGGHVKEVVPGKYEWVVSFDLTSLYPMLIQQYNISPDTIVEDLYNPVDMDMMVNGDFQNETEYSMAANGYFFRKDAPGFLTEMMADLYEGRAAAKQKMLACERLLEKISEEKAKRTA